VVKSLLLDTKGTALGLIMAGIIYAYLSWQGVALLLLFLILSVAVTRYGEEEKKALNVFEYERGVENVFSNGIVAVVAAVLSPIVGPLPYAAALAGAMADKMGSEVGIFDERVIDLLSLKRVERGTDGGVSPLGLFASLAGASVIALAAMLLFPISSQALVVAWAGFAGSLADSLAGHFERKGWWGKGFSNIVGTATSALLAYLFA